MTSADATPATGATVGGLKAHIAVTKPRIIELLLVTAIPTMFLAARGLPQWQTAVVVLIGGAAAAAGANTFNSIYDRDIDALMARTGHRPAVTGQISVRAGMLQGTVLSIIAVGVLWWGANALAALLGFAAIVFYAVVYTMLLKRRTDQNIVWGGAAGCFPVLIAWAAVTGSLTWTPVVLFLIVFFWTPPHYWPLAMRFRDDYAAARVPMLPVTRDDATVARHILGYSWVLVAVSVALIPVGAMGIIYSLAAGILGAFFLYMAYRLRSAVAQGTDVEGAAMRLFHGSITYLALLFLAIGVDPFVGSPVTALAGV